MKRLDTKDAEELRKQLLEVPELALDAVPGTGAQLATIAQQLRTVNGVYPGPLLLQRQRPDLASLPLLVGKDCQLGVEPASALQALSRKLRTVLEGCIPAGGSDPRPHPDKLRAVLLGDDPDHPPEWVQADAVPALMQLLQAEDRQLRKVLVEVLGRIKDVRATQALAVRAMTDLDPEVRTQAVKELTQRPGKDYRDLLVAGLRYPWLPVMEHAAEALVAVKAIDAVPQLVPMLDDPDPRQPTTIPLGQAKKLLVPEMVRVNHLRNCLLCHAPSFDTNDLVRGAVPTPGKPLPGPATTPAYYAASNSFVRADVTYLRQDFSVVQPVADSGVWPSQQRFDYLVRMRPPMAREMELFRDKKASDKGPREVLLFALRELTGKDLGLTSKEWKKVVPEDSLVQAQQARLQGTESTEQGDWKQLHTVAQTGSAPAVETRVEELRDELVRAAPDKRGEVLARLRDGKGVVYTTALAQAIKDLKGPAQTQARDALAERLTRLKETTLHDKLRDDNAEVRRAAARACGMKKAEAFLPNLIAMLYDSDPDVVQAARGSLKTLTDRDEGPDPGATPEQRRAAQEAWRVWWEQHIQPPKKR
jgi:HEAT repeat protein